MVLRSLNLLLSLFFVCYGSVSLAQEKIKIPLNIPSGLEQETPEPKMPETAAGPKFVEGELIVQFKHDEGEAILSDPAKDPVLNKILEKHPLEYTGHIFPEFKTKDALARHVQTISDKFPERAKRAYDDFLPDLQRYFVLVFRDQKTPVEQVAAELMTSPNVESAEPNSIGWLDTLPTLIPNDPYFSSSNSWGQGFEDQWGLHIIRAPEAWQIEHGRTDKEKVTIAVIDTGMDWSGSYPILRDEIGSNLWINTNEEPAPRNHRDDDKNGYIDDRYGANLSQLQPDSLLPYDGGTDTTYDPIGHGTAVAGIIAAKGDNSVGIAGMMWDARLMAIQTAGARGDLKSFQVAKGILYAADNGADVINMSFGHMTGSLVRQVMRYAAAQGVVLVASSGNEKEHSIVNRTPAGFKDVITVGASTHLDTHASYSNYGFGLDVVAPGGERPPNLSEILSLKSGYYNGDPEKIVDNFYLREKGTSFAAPHVSGLAGLLISKEPDLSVEEIRQRIRMTAADIEDQGWDLKTGWGRIDAYGALESSDRCIARLDFPKNESTLDYRSIVKILGSVGGASFNKYTLELNFDGHSKTLVSDGTVAVERGILADITLSRIGRYIVRLTAYDASGSMCAEDIISFTKGLKFSDAVLPVPLNPSETRQDIWPIRMEFVQNGIGGYPDNLLLEWAQGYMDGGNAVIAGFPNLRNHMTLPFTTIFGVANNDNHPSTAGDLNGDGRDEIAIIDAGFHRPSGINYEWGQVAIKWTGSASYTSIENFFVSPYFGSCLLFPPASGDWDGDGKRDLIIMHGNEGLNQPAALKLYIFLGKSASRWFQPQVSASSADIKMDLPIDMMSTVDLGLSIQSGYDVNGDGFHDILVHRKLHRDTPDTTTTYLIPGGNPAAQPITFRAKEAHRSPYNDSKCFGRFVDDINGDGLGDIAFDCATPLVTAAGTYFDRPAVQVFLGRRNFPASLDILDDADAKWKTEEFKPILGGSLGIIPLGNVDGDGLADLALLTKKQIYLLTGSDDQNKWHKDDFLYNADQVVDLPFTVASPTDRTVPYNQNTGDADGNGSSDLLFSEQNTNNIHILFVDDKPQSLLRPEMLTGFSGYAYSGTVRMRLYNDGTENAKISGLAVANKGRARLRVQSESCTGAEILPHSFCNITLQEGTSFWSRLFDHHPADLKIKANDKNADAYGNLEFPIGW